MRGKGCYSRWRTICYLLYPALSVDPLRAFSLLPSAIRSIFNAFPISVPALITLIYFRNVSYLRRNCLSPFPWTFP